MTWGWHQVSKTCYRFDDTWTVERDWVTGWWYAHRDGKACLADFKDAGAAMDEADRLRLADRDYKPLDPAPDRG